jgi:hypothetical protein
MTVEERMDEVIRLANASLVLSEIAKNLTAEARALKDSHVAVVLLAEARGLLVGSHALTQLGRELYDAA